MLLSSGVTGSALLAGCLGDQETDGEDDTGQPDDTDTDDGGDTDDEEPAGPVEVPESEDQLAVDRPEEYQANEVHEFVATFENPADSDVDFANVVLELTGLPEDWSVSAAGDTQFDTLPVGEEVEVTWEVEPLAGGPVEYRVAASYEVEGESYGIETTEEMLGPLIAFWRFEDDTTDDSGRDNEFLLENDAEFTDQEVVEGDYALALDGEDDFIFISNEGTGFHHTAFSVTTVSLWVNPDSTDGEPVIYSRGGSKNGLAIRFQDGELQAQAAADWEFTTVSAAYDATGWAHVGLVFELGELRLYLNGEKVASTDGPFDFVPDHGSGGAIGKAGSNSYAFEGEGEHLGGYVDAVKIYQSALSGDQIADLAAEY